MQHGANRHMIALSRVENQVRLKAEAPIAGLNMVEPLADLRKVGDQPEGANKPGVVGSRLICAEAFFGKIVNVYEVGAGSPRDSKVTHGVAP